MRTKLQNKLKLYFIKMFNKYGFYWGREKKESGIIPNYLVGWDSEFGIIWKGEPLINEFGLYRSKLVRIEYQTIMIR